MAHDRDAGLAGTLTYSVVQGDERGVFQLDATSGWLSVVRASELLYTPGAARVTLLVQAEDGGFLLSAQTRCLKVECYMRLVYVCIFCAGVLFRPLFKSTKFL